MRAEDRSALAWGAGVAGVGLVLRAAGAPGWLAALVLAGGLGRLLIPLAGRLARGMGAVDEPGPRRIHRTPTPRLGGVAVFLAFLAALWAGGGFAPAVRGVVLAAAVIFALGAADDARGLPAGLRLLVQAVAVGILVQAGVVVKLVPPQAAAWWWAVDVPLTFLWMLAVTNAFNFLDGMDGLAGGLGVIAAGVLGVLAWRTGTPDLGVAAAALAGAALGFLPANWRPGRPALIFLGDSGSTFLGFTLGALAIVGDWSPARPLVSACVPVLVFFVPLFDLAYTSVERFATGKVSTLGELLAYAGTDHIHHRLAAVFGSRTATVVFIHAFAATVGLAAVALPRAEGGPAAVLLVQVLGVAGLVSALEVAARRRLALREDRP